MQHRSYAKYLNVCKCSFYFRFDFCSPSRKDYAPSENLGQVHNTYMSSIFYNLLLVKVGKSFIVTNDDKLTWLNLIYLFK